METVEQKIAALRREMQATNLDAFIIPSTDSHNSEYTAEHWQARAWLSGFTGSAGTIVITQEEAGLWTDYRYFLQAQKQIERSEIKLFKLKEEGVLNYRDWLATVLKTGNTVGINSELFTFNQVKKLKKELKNKGILLNIDLNPIEKIWTERPPLPAGKIFQHDPQYTGLSTIEKLKLVRGEMEKKGANSHLITSLDDIAWLFNIRGRDLPYSPVVISYALITSEEATLFVRLDKMGQELAEVLQSEGVRLLDYTKIKSTLKAFSPDSIIWLDPNQVNAKMFNSLSEEVEIITEQQPTINLKASKHPDEIKQYKRCQRRDAVAMIRFRIWLEQEVPEGKVTELKAEEKIDSLRGKQEKFFDLSFHSIVGYAHHGAIVHYAASTETDIPVKEGSYLLVDSGGQYLDGTTDITRTYCFGELTEEEKKDYTLVLKGHIRLAKSRFKAKTTGAQLEVLAREAMWAEGLDYGHGSGHGTGYFLNVHEGPHGFSHRSADAPLEVGMFITNEPGLYREGKHGIRLENMMLVVEDGETEFGAFNRFEVLSLVPFELKPIKKELLATTELEWLNRYHARVYKEISPLLTEQEKVWLAKNTKSL